MAKANKEACKGVFIQICVFLKTNSTSYLQTNFQFNSISFQSMYLNSIPIQGVWEAIQCFPLNEILIFTKSIHFLHQFICLTIFDIICSVQ
jgi:hypothetical protein